MRSQRPFQFDVLRSRSPVLPTPSIFLLPIPLSFSLSVLFSLCLAAVSHHVAPRPVRSSRLSLPICTVGLFLLFALRVPFAKLRSIFHLEPRRSLAINPRIHYGLRNPYCSFFARHPHVARLPTGLLVRSPARLLARLPASAGHRLRFASLRGTTSTIQTRRLSGMRRHSRSLVRRRFSRVSP